MKLEPEGHQLTATARRPMSFARGEEGATDRTDFHRFRGGRRPPARSESVEICEICGPTRAGAVRVLRGGKLRVWNSSESLSASARSVANRQDLHPV